MKICFVLGTRPEIIKTSPVIKQFQKEKFNFFIIHTGQHYSYFINKIFFEELNLPNPEYNLNIGSGTHGMQTGKMLEKIEEVLLKEKPEIVMVQGDTNSTLAGALAATKLKINVGHIEAGLRSFDMRMPEEKNRKLTEEEYERVKKHPEIAVDIIRSIRNLHSVIPIILHHHERWNGKGYPEGLKGEDIPLESRIIAVADVYHALTSNRPYRKAYSKNEAMEIIKNSSGTDFDPKIVEIFLKILKEEK